MTSEWRGEHDPCLGRRWIHGNEAVVRIDDDGDSECDEDFEIWVSHPIHGCTSIGFATGIENAVAIAESFIAKFPAGWSGEDYFG